MKKLLVCTDGSPYSEVCYDYAIWIAKRIGASIDLLYVSDARQFEMGIISDVTGSLGVQPFQGIFTQLQAIENEKVRVIRERAHKLFQKHGFGGDKVGFHHRNGFLTDCLQEFDEDTVGIDLLALGKRGENANFATEHLGSSMERVVRSSNKPCLVTSRKYREIKKVLVAYDGSPCANKVIQFLARSRDFFDLEMHLVTATDPDGDETNAQHFNRAERVLREADYKLTCQMLPGDPADQIASYVEENTIDLLCMGAYGHSAIRHLLIGSTTTDLIRRCRIPILLFR